MDRAYVWLGQLQMCGTCVWGGVIVVMGGLVIVILYIGPSAYEHLDHSSCTYFRLCPLPYSSLPLPPTTPHHHHHHHPQGPPNHWQARIHYFHWLKMKNLCVARMKAGQELCEMGGFTRLL